MATETQIELMRYCNTESVRFSVPWVFDGWKYATNGLILVRVPTEEQNSESNSTRKSAPGIIGDVQRETQFCEKTPWPERNRDPVREACPDCDGGWAEGPECTECGGDGEIECRECGNADDCKKCGGRGYQKITCTKCNGIGEVEGSHQLLTGDIRINGKIDDLVRVLPNVKCVIRDSGDIVPFWFDGGEGLLMPLTR